MSRPTRLMVADLKRAGWRVLASEVVILRQIRRTWQAPDGSRLNSTERAWKLLPEAAQTKAPGKRGFAAMSAERRRELGSQGSRIAHANGTAYTWTSEQARAAGRKGGRA
jgi:general stress protein YciG